MEQNNSDFKTVLQEWATVFARRSIHDFLKFAHQNGISMPQINILMRLYYRGPATIASLREDLYGSRAAATQLINRLFESGLVERVEAETDRRLKVISLTPEGRALVEKGIAARRKWLEDLSDSFDGEQKEQFRQMMQFMVEAAVKLEISAEKHKGGTTA
jgi:DNA-binding MarR family transcriptional regulator